MSLTTPLTHGHFPLQELGVLEGEEEEVLDLIMLTFDEVNVKIEQERKKYCAMNPTKPLSVTMTKDIVHNIIENMQIITSTGATVFATTEHNYDLPNRLYASKLRATMVE